MSVAKSLFVAMVFFIASLPSYAEVDPDSGLIIDEGWDLVRAQCAACHSLTLVTQNRGSRDDWLYLFRWMQETQNLWPIPPEFENTMLDYLANNYGVKPSARRQPLPSELMPK